MCGGEEWRAPLRLPYQSRSKQRRIHSARADRHWEQGKRAGRNDDDEEREDSLKEQQLMGKWAFSHSLDRREQLTQCIYEGVVSNNMIATYIGMRNARHLERQGRKVG